MKQTPRDLQLNELNERIATFVGPEGALRLTLLGRNVVEVRYDFSAFPVEESLERGAALLYDDERETEADVGSFLPIEAPGKPEITALTQGELRLEVDRSRGDLAVYRGQRCLHGGRVGSDDTVLPRYPIRVHGTPPNHVYGAFHAPLHRGDRFFGLGDKSGWIDRRGRRFLMHNRDALGYRGRFADPLYKSVPFLIKQNPETGVCLGIAVAAPDVQMIDLGVESEYFYSFALRNGPFRYVLFFGESYLDILERYTWLSGRPAFPPAFTFGFLGSSMDYTEPDDAPKRVSEYLDAVEEHGIPCEGVYLSSGYYRNGDGFRHTFEWNRKKFPDPQKFIGEVRNRGYHVSCNVKPGILTNHPRFDRFAESGTLLRDEQGSTYTEYYWGGDAGLWDFGSAKGEAEWRRNLREQLLDLGVDGIWNDNNEYEIEDSCLPAYSRRSVMALLMCKASWDEALAREPDRRPWIISRSGSIGIQRYARTWSGDNVSSWESLLFNTVMGSSFGLSGMPFFGHDIGGFFGERPDSEQFLRWCQSAVFQPRFVIHSWNDDSQPTELWSYKGIFDSLRSLVFQHYEYMPYTYSLARESHRSGAPIQRHPFVEYPQDPQLTGRETSYLYGPYLLIALVVEPSAESVEYLLPEADRWYDPDLNILYAGGTRIEKRIHPDRVPYLVREGSIVPRAPGARSAERGWHQKLTIDLYPGSREERFLLFEDDGRSRLQLSRWSETAIKLHPKGEDSWVLETEAAERGAWMEPSGQEITFALPDGFLFSGRGSGSVTVSRDEMRRGLQLRLAGEYLVMKGE